MPKGGDTQRKEWDKEEYRQKAKEREKSYKKVEVNVDKSTLGLLEARHEILNIALDGINQKKTVSSIDAVIMLIGNIGFSLRNM